MLSLPLQPRVIGLRLLAASGRYVYQACGEEGCAGWRWLRRLAGRRRSGVRCDGRGERYDALGAADALDTLLRGMRLRLGRSERRRALP
jgi:hypothetical protein